MRLNERDRLVLEGLKEVVQSKSTSRQIGRGLTNKCIVSTLPEVPVIASGGERYAPRVIVAPFKKPNHGTGVEVRSIDSQDVVGGEASKRFQLPSLPLDVYSTGYDLIRHEFPNGVPSTSIKMWSNASGNFGIFIHASDALTYERVYEGTSSELRERLYGGDDKAQTLVGKGSLDMSGISVQPKILPRSVADDFEMQLFEGAVEMIRTLIDRALTGEPINWSDSVKGICTVARKRRDILKQLNTPATPQYTIIDGFVDVDADDIIW